MSKYATVDFASAPLGPEIARIAEYVGSLPFPVHVNADAATEKAVSEYVISRSKEFLRVRHEKELCLFLLGKHRVYNLGTMQWLANTFREAKDNVMGFISPFANVPGVSEFVMAMFNKYKKHRLALAKRTSEKLHPFLSLEELQDNIRDFGTPYPVRDLMAGPADDSRSSFVLWLNDPDTTYVPSWDPIGVAAGAEVPAIPDFDFYD